MDGGIVKLGRTIKAGEGRNMKTRTKILIALVFLAVVDTVIPLPITAGILLYALVERSAWFRDLVSEAYSSS